MTNGCPRCVVIGIGNADRGDDGAGRAVARGLRRVIGGRSSIGVMPSFGRITTDSLVPGSEHIEIIEHSGEATAVIAHMDGAEHLFLIDACVSGTSPGTIRRFDVSSAAMPALTSGFSTHGFGLASAIEFARALGQLPRRAIVYAIEGTSFEAGAPLSPPVVAAVPEAVRRLYAEIEGTHAL
jgi:hydrogenase maturation protease